MAFVLPEGGAIAFLLKQGAGSGEQGIRNKSAAKADNVSSHVSNLLKLITIGKILFNFRTE